MRILCGMRQRLQNYEYFGERVLSTGFCAIQDVCLGLKALRIFLS